jgi:hypothetical protein
MEKYNQILIVLESMKKDMEKFYDKGVNAAATRIRKDLNEVRKLAADFRKEIQEIRAKRKAEGK